MKIFIKDTEIHFTETRTTTYSAKWRRKEKKGRAAGIHINLWRDNKSLIKIKKNIWTDRILKLSVNGTFKQIAYAICKGYINAQNI